MIFNTNIKTNTMKKISTYLLALIGVLTWGNSWSQAGSYSFTSSSGTYVPLVGGTDVDAIEVDFGISASLPIGFTFNFDGTDYTTFKAASDGFISFNASATGQTTNNLDAVAAATRPLVAPLWDDHAGAVVSGSQASYALSGVPGSQVMTFEWLNWEWNYSASTPIISFQVKLYEGTNVVEFIYRGEAGAVSSGSASIGISGVSTFISLDGTGATPATSTTTEFASLNTKPADGQIYSFTPPSCVAPGGLNVMNLTGTSADFAWTQSGTASEWEVAYGTPGFTPVASGVTTTTNPQASGTLTASTDYEFYVRTVCAVGDTSDWSGPFAFTTPCAVLTPPYLQTFDTFLPDACWDEATNGTMATGPTGLGTGSWGANSNLSSNTADVNIYGSGVSDWVLTPYFDLSGGMYKIDIDVAVTNWNSAAVDAMEADDEVILAYTEDGGATWLPIYTWTVADNLPNALTPFTFYNPSNGANVQFAVYASSGTTTGTDYDFHIDNFSIDLMPPCPDPSSIVSTWIDNDSIAFSWTAGYLESNWNVEVGAVGFTPGTGSAVYTGTSIQPADSAAGLTQLTDYDVYVQADCGGGDMSAWVGPVTISTGATCADVSAITIDASSADSLFVSWTSNGTEAMWDVEFGPTGYTAGSGTMMSGTTTNDTITGLMSNSSYDIYVRSDCGGVDQGMWVGPVTYVTGCLDLLPVTLPFIEDFESMSVTIIGDSAFYCGVDKSWNFTTDLQGFGRVRTGVNSVAALAGNGSMTMDVTVDNNDAISYATLRLDLSNYASSNLLKFSCKYMEHGDETDTDDRVWVRGSDQDAWVEILNWNAGTGGTSGSVFQLVEFDLSTVLSVFSQVPSSTFEVRFGWSDNYAATSATGTDGVSFDDIRIEEVTCNMPTNFAVTYSNADSVVLGWTENGSATDWVIEYGPLGFTQGSGTVVNTTFNPDTITGLVAGNIYDFYLQSDCGAGDLSNAFGPIEVVPNVLNDSACQAITVNVDGIPVVFGNQGSTNTGEPGATSYSTVWFEFVAPVSGHVAIATCGATVSNEISLFDVLADCADYPSYSELTNVTTNPWNCDGLNTPAGLEACGLTPGATYRFKVGNTASSGAYSTFPVTLWDLGYDAGTGSTIAACASTDTVNLVGTVTGSNSYVFDGFFEYPSNPAVIINDTLAVAANFTLGNKNVYYIVENSCMSDTALITINVSTESNSGTAISPFTMCNSGDVVLLDGLAGTIDAGGTWTDDSGTGLLVGVNGNIFAATGIPVGSYPFTYTVSNGVCPNASTSINVILTTCTSVDENSIEFSIYPNPNDGNFNITSNVSEVVVITVMDVQGKIVYNNKMNITGGTPEVISLDKVETGMYVLKVASDSNVSTQSFIVK
jgi:hypothetical protein